MITKVDAILPTEEEDAAQDGGVSPNYLSVIYIC